MTLLWLENRRIDFVNPIFFLPCLFGLPLLMYLRVVDVNSATKTIEVYTISLFYLCFCYHTSKYLENFKFL